MSAQATVAEIDLNAVATNIELVRKKVSPARVMAVVKADGYGHGATRIAGTAMQHGADFLGVAHVEEGIKLRKEGIRARVLVMGAFFQTQAVQVLHHDLDATVFDFQRADALSKVAREFKKPARIHIKVDTGMGRLGVHWKEAAEFVRRVAQESHLQLVGIFTHFATADQKNKDFAYTQLERFRRILNEIRAQGIQIPVRHVANSAAVLSLPESYFDMVRLGVSMYGYYPSPETSATLALKPAMSLKSRVAALKEIEPGGYVSYNLTFQAQEKTTIAVVPIGYGDGFNRLLSNRARVLIGGRRYPVVGTVCMDLIMANVGASSEVQVGDEVVLLGRQGQEEISIYEWCETLKTIPYEITCWVSKRVPRVYRRGGLGDGQMVRMDNLR
ncbi:MAG: alanine racemase [bacterium]